MLELDFDKIKNNFLNFCENIDFFGVTFNFRVNKKSLYGSATGGFCFLIFLLLAIIFFYQSLIEFLTSNKMTLAFIEKSLNPTPKLNFSDYNFAYAISITFDNETNINFSESLYPDLFITESNYVKSVNKIKSKTQIKSRPCDKQDFKSLSNDKLFNIKHFDEFICFEDISKISIYGSYTDSEMAYVEYLLKLNPKYFQNFSELSKIFIKNQFKLSMYYIETFNDVSSVDQPIFYKLDSIYSYIDFQFFKRLNIYFQEYIFSDDNTLLLEDYKSFNYMKRYSNEEVFISIKDRELANVSEDKYNLVKFFLRGTNFQKTVKRSYQKLPEFIAIVIGLLVNLLFALAAIMTLWNEFKAKQIVMNKILKFKDSIKENNYEVLKYLKDQQDTVEEENNKDEFIYRKNTLDKSKLRSTNSIKSYELKEIPGRHNSLNEKLIQKEELQTEKKKVSSKFSMSNSDDLINRERSPKILNLNGNSHSINFGDLFNSIFSPQKFENKKIIFENAESKFNYYLDLITYMNKMQEIDMIKYLILDEDSLNILNFISKPSVSIKSDSSKNEILDKFFMNNQEDVGFTIDKANNLKKSYINIKSKQEQTEIDKKIIKLFELQVQELMK